MAQKPVIGLVGGIGSGKSAAAAAFGRHGARVISGDALGHEALRQPAIRERVVKRWGDEVLDERGEVNRRRLGKIVFGDPAERSALEALVVPWIERGLQEEVAAARNDPCVRFVVVDAAIMLETGWNKICDAVVYVDTPREIRLRRLADQRGWTVKEVRARESAQMPLDEKRRRANYVLDNSAGLEKVEQQVEGLLRQWGLGT